MARNVSAASQILAQLVETHRGAVASLGTAPTAEALGDAMKFSFGTSLPLLEQLVAQLDTMRSYVSQSRRSLADSRAVSGLDVLSSDKSEFR